MRSAARGFTLIEIMVALAILALVLVMLTGSFHAVARSKAHGESRLALEREGRTILWQMIAEVRSAVQTPLVPSRVLFLGAARMSNFLPVDELTVSTLDLSHRAALGVFGPETIVAYRVVPNPDRSKWNLLEYSQQNGLLPSDSGTRPPPEIVLADNVLALHIRYFDGYKWLESWNSAVQPLGRALPQEVAIDLVLSSRSGARRTFSTRTQLPMAYATW